jgi:hypothetical protein
MDAELARRLVAVEHRHLQVHQHDVERTRIVIDDQAKRAVA